ncbi:hypothetical protein [Thermococcus thioreducens]|uniref:Uncharacterized protein n=1 Tax=Thermococcus thioreducens TaxID=277988 RepID=A0A0Q2M1K9_9EURY|nr:hypothetical protein [Thermococcus thioreducens]ASJ11773.1 hypothetical protein A3L14_02205 [Thermococcus thioreducens]KQH81937.1 hypothetical protein AMR53_08330 [Thermococcus thioreducens]SEW14092.1 hypothetical protein SAMN05216170_1839 [Thermococcus thioreducens]
MIYKDPTKLKILKSMEFIKQIGVYTILCVGRFFFPHPELKTSPSFEFYGTVAAYFLLTLALVFSYEILHDAFSSNRDEFSKATPKERWMLRLFTSAYFAFLLATPEEEKLTLLVAWVFGTTLAYTVTKVRLRTL